MKKFHLPVILALIGIALINLISRPGAASSDGHEQGEPASVARAPDPIAGGLAAQTGGSIMSPFGSVASAPVKSEEQRISERKAMMQQDKIETPENYFRMNLSELKARAAKKDVFALLQLAYQYGSEYEALERQPGYDASVSPEQESFNYMAEAMAAGHSHSAAVLAERYWRTGDLLTAYAWNAMAESLGDSSGAGWSKDAFTSFQPEEQARADKKAADVLQLAMKRFDQPVITQ